MNYLWIFLLCFAISAIVTPFIIRISSNIGAIDKPNSRKVHGTSMPSSGGIAIFLAFFIGFLYFTEGVYVVPILISSILITLIGFLDDIFDLKPRWKLLGQALSASIIIISGIHVQFINLPFGGELHLGWFGIPFTFLWIIGITNSINLIDGLDGLAAGVSIIVLITITGLAFIDNNFFVVTLGLILIGGTLGFLIYNFNPAKVFMGDTGALFLGFMISIISLLGFKNVTVFSLLIPVIILAVPISDTLFAIIRRLVKRKPLSTADSSHLHHCLLKLGYTHRQTVLIIYGMSAFFGLAAVMLTQTTLWGALFIIILLLVVIELIAELFGLVSATYKPVINFLRRIINVK